MKQDEIKPCSFCDKGVMHDGSPIFYHIKMDTLGVNAAAVQKQTGFEQMMGGGPQAAAIAFHMGPQEDIAEIIDSSEKIVCLSCMMMDKPLALLIGNGD